MSKKIIMCRKYFTCIGTCDGLIITWPSTPSTYEIKYIQNIDKKISNEGRERGSERNIMLV